MQFEVAALAMNALKGSRVKVNADIFVNKYIKYLSYITNTV